MVRKNPEMPNQVPIDIECRILDYIKEYPTHGPQRICNQLNMEKYGSIKVGHTGVYGCLGEGMVSILRRNASNGFRGFRV